MALWANTDDAANSTIYAAAQVNKTPNTANQTALFGNTTADAYFTGATIGQFGVTQDEAVAGRAEGKKVTHSGWVLETIGSGGRAGRVQPRRVEGQPAAAAKGRRHPRQHRRNLQ